MRRPRHLSASEKALWDMVAARATPIRPETSVKSVPARPNPAKTRIPLPEFEVGAKVSEVARHNLAPGVGMQLRQAPLQMDAKSFEQMTRGKLKPEARIDLHGMTVAEAHPELVDFILRAHAAGKRLVLVITGKGKSQNEHGPIPVRKGVLRHQVPQWLNLPPLGSCVLQITPSHKRHGGDGAYYVYLRRHR